MSTLHQLPKHIFIICGICGWSVPSAFPSPTSEVWSMKGRRPKCCAWRAA